jgi:cation:H+ antiporter
MSAVHEPAGSERATGRDLLFMILAVAVTLPWLYLRFQSYHGDPTIMAGLAGLAIVGAAFMLSWAAEAF